MHGGTYTGTNRTPAIFWFNDPRIHVGISTDMSENENGNLYLTGVTYPYWIHLSIRVCGSGLEAKLC